MCFQLELSWRAADSVSGIRKYSVLLARDSTGLSSIAGPFVTKHSTEKISGLSLEDGGRLFVIVTANNRAGLSANLTFGQSLWTPASQSFRLKTRSDSQLLVVCWGGSDFQDPESHVLEFEVGVGSRRNSTDIVPYPPVVSAESQERSRAANISSVNSTCAVLRLQELDWNLIGEHTYHVSIRCTNGARLTTTVFAEPMVHTNRLPTQGIVMDEDPDANLENMFGVPHDIRYQLRADTLRSRWSGFKYATSFQTYFTKVSATNALGTVSATSNGVTVESRRAKLGLHPMNVLPPVANETRRYMVEMDFQSSLSTIRVQWTRPRPPLDVIFHTAYWSLERKLTHDWQTVEDFRRVAYNNDTVVLTNLHLKNGSMYRSLLKLCSERVCSEAEATPELMVLHTPPSPSDWSVNLEPDNKTINLNMKEFNQFPSSEKNTISHYQWSLQHDGANILNWTDIDLPSSDIASKSIIIELPWPVRSTKCLQLAVRCFNRAGLSTIDKRQLRDCSAYDPKLIIDPTVTDAIGP
uniref:Fibronectin type-III domain-containing protein n=1 Tax=Macrostomum lignano TaxID=282301 RepID=A0A1I8GAU5_9PLAT